MAEDRKSQIDLNFEYDPKVVDQYVRKLNQLKTEVKDSAGVFDGFQNAIKGVGGVIKTAAAAVGGLFTLDQFHEAEQIPKRFAHIFSGIEAEARKTAIRLKDEFGLSFEDAQMRLVRIQEQLLTLGIGDRQGLKISDDIIKAATDVSNALGLSFEKTLSTFEGFVTSGGASTKGFAEIFKENKKLLDLIFKFSEDIRISDLPDAARAGMAAGFLRREAAPFEGSAREDPSLAFLQRDVKSDVANLFNEVVRDLLPNLKSFAKVIAELTKDMEKLAPIVADIVRITALVAGFGLAGKIPKFLSKFKGFLPGIAAVGAYEVGKRAKTGIDKLTEGEVGFESEGALDRIKGFGQDLLEKGKQNLLNVTNNITVNARTDDPKRLGEILSEEIENRSEMTLKKLSEKEIPEQTSEEK